MKPRPYQREAIAASLASLRHGRSALAVLPTGTGKTVTFMAIVKRYVDAGHRVLILAHRRELLDQAHDKGLRIGISGMAIEQADRRAPAEARVVLASVQSLVGRLDRFRPDHFALVIHDEAHRALAETHRQILDHFDRAKVLGWTATPDRGDERALAAVFDQVAYDLTLADAIAGGWLVPPVFRQIELRSLDLSRVRSRSGDLQAGDLGAVLSEVEVLAEAIGPSLAEAGHKKAIVFCATRAHLACVAECVRSMASTYGYDLQIDALDGTTPPAVRQQIFDDFRAHSSATTGGRWLLNVDVATEGFDVPDVDAVIVLRPTLARSRYMQMIGRGLRPLDGLVDDVDPEVLQLLDDPGLTGTMAHLAVLRSGLEREPLARRVAIASSAKPECLILDFAGNSARHDLAGPADLLGGDFSEAEIRAAERAAAADMTDLWTALERARIERAGVLEEKAARAGDPFALFGISPPPVDRWGRRPTAAQARVIASLRQPRPIGDAREANAVVRELARRSEAGLALYSQAALLAACGWPIQEIRTMSRRAAAEAIRRLAASGWKPTDRASTR